MIGTIVTLRYPEGIDRSAMQKIADDSRSMFDGMAGLRTKAYTVDAERNEAVNFYLWDSEDAARGFFTDDVRELITTTYGVAPEIRHVEIATVVENSPAAVA
jgi:hypothetical protein